MTEDLKDLSERESATIIARKMVNVMSGLKRMKKRGKNDKQNYSFTSIDDIADAIRVGLVDVGLALFASMIECTSTNAGKTKDGANITRAHVKMLYELVCVETGASKVFPWESEADDYSDKAVNKAASYAEKFWLKQTFMVSTGEEDPDAQSPVAGTPPPQQRQQQPNGGSQYPAWATKPNVNQVLKKAKDLGHLEPNDDLAAALRLVGKPLTQFSTGQKFYNAIVEAGERAKTQLGDKTLHPNFGESTPEMQERAAEGQPVKETRTGHVDTVIYDGTWLIFKTDTDTVRERSRQTFAKLLGDYPTLVEDLDIVNWHGSKEQPIPYPIELNITYDVKPNNWCVLKSVTAIGIDAETPESPAQPDPEPAEQKVSKRNK